MFCSGHTYFVQHMPHKLGLDPYVAHATFQYGASLQGPAFELSIRCLCSRQPR